MMTQMTRRPEVVNEHINLFILSDPGKSENGLLRFRKLVSSMEILQF